MNKIHPNKEELEILSPKFIRAYIAEARKIAPKIPKNLHNYIVGKYVEKRNSNNFDKNSNKMDFQYITPRTLLAILRISQGIARLRFNHEVDQEDVDNALKLIDSS